MSRWWTGWIVAGALLASTPAFVSATPQPDVKRAVAAKPAKKKVTTELASAESLRPEGLGAFTPSIVDPSRSAALSRPSIAAERTVRFTPSGKAGDRKALTLGLTTRVSRPEPTRTAAATPAAYNVGLTLGLEGFALSGGYSRVESLFGGRREGVDLGLSYRGARWKAALQASNEQAVSSGPLYDPVSLDRRYGVELGGAYAVTPRLSVTGGMRYQMITPLDPKLHALNDRRADPSVYVGTAFSF
ncbi:MAG: hypothetical protein INF91_12205 [Alphaproteobacteria bacterium]|nr:hypothetical protein [Alphaproteobacteria bacterium]